MQSFEELFLLSKGKPVVYKSQTIHMVDRFTMCNGQVFTLTFESANSDWRQGVCVTTDGEFTVNNQSIKKSIILWQDTAPKVVSIKVTTPKGEIQVKNVWDVGDGTVHSWHNGAAMIVEILTTGKRYKCNDGRADDDFDDLVFRIEPN